MIRFFCSIFGVLILVTPSRANISLDGSPSRYTVAEIVDGDIDHDLNNIGGHFLGNGSVTGATSFAELSSNAHQASIIPASEGLGMSGAGSAAVSVDGVGTGLLAASISHFYVSFAVTSANKYELFADIDWEGTGFPDVNGASLVRIVDFTELISNDIVFAQYDGQNPGGESIHFVGDFFPGRKYYLVIESYLEGRGSVPGIHSGTGSWSFSFFPVVPEPTTASILVWGAMLMATTSRRRNSNP